MKQNLTLTLAPKVSADQKYYKPIIAKKLGIEEHFISLIRILRKSIDARSRDIKVNMEVQVFYNDPAPELEEFQFNYENVSDKPEVIIVGAGPAGLFAGLKLIQLGFKPIIFERGKDVSGRKKDLALLQREHILNEDSNFCFGEGGAGAFSDGKLYTRSKKRGDVSEILNLLHFHGADENILYEAQPHIGTDKLPRVIKNIRETITEAGGEIYFESKIVDLISENGFVKGIKTKNGDKVHGIAVVLATGHSARDVYELLHEKKITMEAKPFAMGVRVEHPQDLIDSIQYHSKNFDPYLPPASYKLVQQIEGRGVYSFCMCPGGYVVPASTSQNEMVVNGMSPAKRNSPFANSGMVVEIKLEDINEFKSYGELAGVKFQQKIEQMAFLNGGSGFTAPAQKLTDFVNGKMSANLPPSSYIPGIISSPVHFWLPEFISKRLQKSFIQFDKKMRGYLTGEALVIGVESRTSSPIRIIREKDTLQHPVFKGLYPCGEGAGYAGGIVSAAIDGIKCAEKIIENK